MLTGCAQRWSPSQSAGKILVIPTHRASCGSNEQSSQANVRLSPRLGAFPAARVGRPRPASGDVGCGTMLWPGTGAGSAESHPLCPSTMRGRLVGLRKVVEGAGRDACPSATGGPTRRGWAARRSRSKRPRTVRTDRTKNRMVLFASALSALPDRVAHSRVQGPPAGPSPRCRSAREGEQGWQGWQGWQGCSRTRGLRPWRAPPWQPSLCCTCSRVSGCSAQSPSSYWPSGPPSASSCWRIA